MVMNDKGKDILKEIESEIGCVPNLFKEMAKSPAVAELYLKGSSILRKTSLSDQEMQAIYLTVSVFNDCDYCKAIHSSSGLKAGLQKEDIEAIKKEELPDSKHLKALLLATRLILSKNGCLTDETLKKLEDRGINRAKLYEISAGIGLITIANYINHLTRHKTDETLVN